MAEDLEALVLPARRTSRSCDFLVGAIFAGDFVSRIVGRRSGRLLFVGHGVLSRTAGSVCKQFATKR